MNTDLFMKNPVNLSHLLQTFIIVYYWFQPTLWLKCKVYIIRRKREPWQCKEGSYFFSSVHKSYLNVLHVHWHNSSTVSHPLFSHSSLFLQKVWSLFLSFHKSVNIQQPLHFFKYNVILLRLRIKWECSPL